MGRFRARVEGPGLQCRNPDPHLAKQMPPSPLCLWLRDAPVVRTVLVIEVLLGLLQSGAVRPRVA